jgi:hypothetical protein
VSERAPVGRIGLRGIGGRGPRRTPGRASCRPLEPSARHCGHGHRVERCDGGVRVRARLPGAARRTDGHRRGPGGFRAGSVRAARGIVFCQAKSDRPEHLPDRCAAGHHHRSGHREPGLCPLGVAFRVPGRCPARPCSRAAGAAAAGLSKRPGAVPSARDRRHPPAREIRPRRECLGCASARRLLHSLYPAAHAPGARLRHAACPCRRPCVNGGARRSNRDGVGRCCLRPARPP